jgi:pSer/pThr/pTyr-binding forkhead associated (FHA) protein
MAILRLRPPSGPPLEFDDDRTLVGRDPSCTVVLEDKSVSRRHVIIERRGPSWHVVDQGSANGTFVDGEQVADAELRDGQELRLGTLPLAVELESEMPQTILMSSPVATAAPPPARPPAARPPTLPRPAGTPAPSAATPASPREEAARRLGLPVTASAYDVSQRYGELSSELEQKLAAAPTPHLQATYRRNLEDLGRAARVLAPGFSPDGAGDADLPSAHPVLVPDALEDSLLEPARPAPPAREPARAEVSGPPLATTLLGGLIVLLLGASGYFWLSETRTGKDLAAHNKSSDLTAARADWQKYEPIDQLEKNGALRNGPLKLCNKAAAAVDVAWLGAVYLADPGGTAAGQGYTVKGYNSLLCRQEFKLSLPPGAETPVSLRSDNERCRWDGQGLFYALYVRRPAPAPARGHEGAEETVYVSGLLNGRQDCVNIGEGW